MYEIKVGIPAPARKTAGRPPVKYPFADMVVGASFFVPLEGTSAEDKKKLSDRLRTNAARFKKVSGKTDNKFMVAEHTDVETQAVSIGVWRTE